MARITRTVTHPRSLRFSELVGWRSWVVSPGRIGEQTGGPVLRGPRGQLWQGPRMEAECLYMESVLSGAVGGHGVWGRHPGPAPDETCRCGIHAMKVDAIEHPADPHSAVPTISGFVELSGVVIEGTYGFRAQHAEIVAPLEMAVSCSHDGCIRSAAGVMADSNRYHGYCWDHVIDPSDLVETEVWLEDVVEALEKRYVAPIVPVGRGGIR